MALLRLGFGVAALGVHPAARRPVERADWGRIAFVALVWMAIPFVLFPLAERSVASSVAGMINSGVPVFAALVAAVFLRRLPGRAQALGLLLGLAGVVLISLPSLGDGHSSAIGVALLVVAVACYGLALNVAVPLQQRYGGLPVLLRAEVAAAAMVAPFALWQAGESSFAWSALLAVAALGVAGTGLAFMAIATLIGRAGATRGSAVSYSFPIVAIALGVWLRDERVHVLTAFGVALVLAGAWAVSRREANRPDV